MLLSIRIPVILSLLVMSTLIVPSTIAQETDDASVRIITEMQQGVPVRGDFVVSPTRQALRLASGAERTVTIEITNRTGEEAEFFLTTEDFAAGDDQNPTILFGNAEGPFPARLWVVPGASRVRLSHGERGFIPVTIRVPAEADPGDHYAAILVARSLESLENADKGFNVLSRVGALFLLSVEGSVMQESNVTNLRASQFFFWSYPARVQLTVENNGTVFAAPVGKLEIHNLLGSLVDELPVKDWFVLRDSTRTLELSWMPSFALGRYTARSIVKMYDNPPQIMETSFWVIPALPVIVVIAVIFLISFLVQLFFSRFEIRKK